MITEQVALEVHNAATQISAVLTQTQQTVLHAQLFFFFNDTATTEIYTLSLHDALPISAMLSPPSGRPCSAPPRTARPPPRSGPRSRPRAPVAILAARKTMPSGPSRRSRSCAPPASVSRS